MKHYEAPWSTSLMMASVVTTILCLGAAAGAWWNLASKHLPSMQLIVLSPASPEDFVSDLALAKP